LSLLPLYLLNLQPAAPPAVTPLRRLAVVGHVGNRPMLVGRQDNALALVGSQANRPALTGSLVMSIAQNLSCLAGEAVVLTVTMDTPPAGGISGWALAFYLKQKYPDLAALVTKTGGSGITVTDAVNGVFTVTLATADTDQTPGNYVYDVWRTDSGQETALAHGRFSIGPAVRP
jgi:hypothetical protein